MSAAFYIKTFVILMFIWPNGTWVQAQDLMNSYPYVLDLREVEVYDYQFEDAALGKVRATSIDWEAVLHEAAANFELKAILLPEKEVLFSLAVSLEVLSQQLESSFFNRRKTYRKFFKKYLTEEEQSYLDEQAERIAKMDSGVAHLALWLYVFDAAETDRQYEVVTDSFISLAYKVKGYDAEDLEAVLSATLGYHYQGKNDLKALRRFERCYAIRKQRKDHLSVNYKRLRTCYKALGLSKKISALDEEVLAIGCHESGFSPDIVTAVFRAFTKKNPKAGVDYFEQRYLKDRATYYGLADYFWEEHNYLPYPIAIEVAETEDEQLYWVDRWLNKMLEYSDPKFYRNHIYPILEFMKNFPSEKMERKRLEIFEAYAFHKDAPKKWKQGASTLYMDNPCSDDERFWFHQLPYGRMLPYLGSVDEKKAYLENWMQQALRTKNDTIIEASALSVSEKLLRFDLEELAGQYFEEYYCKRRQNKALNEHDWLNGNLYSGKEQYLEKLIHLANTYGDFRLVAKLYNHSVIWLKDTEQELRYQRYMNAYEVYKAEGFEQGMSWQLTLILSACKNIPVPLRLEHAIELYEITLEYNYRLELSPLNTIINELLNAGGWSKKELKKSIKILKNWQKQLKKQGPKMQTALDWAKNNELLLKKRLKAGY